MLVEVENRYDYFCELRAEADLTGVPLSSQHCTADLRHLIDEAVTRAVLDERLPADVAEVRAYLHPLWKQEPIIGGVRVTLSAGNNGGQEGFVYEFRSGPWARASQTKLLELRDEGALGESAVGHRFLMALANKDAPLQQEPLDIQPPVIEEGSLEECGILQLGDEDFTPERPVLVNHRFVEDAIRMCEEADVLEAGGAALGRMIRLREPLLNATSRVVTVLSSIVPDPRHVGSESRFEFSPEALAEAQQMAALRGLGEQVLTVFHTHGWSNKCGNCNSNEHCPLFECTPSVHDYEQLLDLLFTSKTTVLPIAGRKLGAAGRRPVLQLYAWSGGEMKPIRWNTYRD